MDKIENRAYSHAAYDTVADYLTKVNFSFLDLRGKGIIKFLSGGNTYIIIFHKTLYSVVVEFGTVKTDNPKVFKVVNDLNFNISRGCFQIDSDSGKIYFRHNISFEGETPCIETVKTSLFLPEITIDRHLKELSEFME